MNIIRYITMRPSGFMHRAAVSLSPATGDRVNGYLAVVVLMWVVVTAIIDQV